MTFVALKERAQRHQRAARRSPVPVRDGPRRRRDRRARRRHRDRRARGEVEAIGREAADAWRTLTFMASAQDRFSGVGRPRRRRTPSAGARSGPSPAPAASTATRAPTSRGLLWYPGLQPARPEQPTGDVAARAQVRAVELEQTCAHARRPARRAARARPSDSRPASPPRSAPAASRARAARPSAASRPTGTASPACTCGPASYANWPVLARVVPGDDPPRLPADQQELRALLRLRGPLNHVRPLQAPPAPAPHGRAARARNGPDRSRCATSTADRATAASTS